MVQMNTQKPMAHCTLEWTDLSQKSRCMRNVLFFIFCNLIPFHISILLEVAATNLSHFGVSSLISSSVVSYIQVETGSTKAICLFWHYWSLLLLTGYSGVSLWQWSSFFKFWGSFACPLFISFRVICRHQGLSWGPHAMMVRDWTFVSGLSCHAQHPLLLQCLPGALPGEVAPLLSVPGLVWGDTGCRLFSYTCIKSVYTWLPEIFIHV